MNEVQTALRLGASILAMLALPFWLGIMRADTMILAAFCVVAGLALTLADDWVEVSNGWVSPGAVIDDVALCTISIAVPASFCFAAAVRFT